MAPVPWSNSHRLDIIYTVAGKQHRVQLGCVAVSSAGVFSLVRNSMADRLAADCAADFAALWKALFHTDVTINSYTLYQYASGSFQPVESGGLTVLGTRSQNTVLTTQGTVVFRDEDYKFFRLIELEGVFAAPFRFSYPTTDVGLDPLIADLLPTASTTNPLWQWVKSRGGRPLASATFFTVSLNRHIRRARGY